MAANNLSTDSDIIRELDSLKLEDILGGTGSPMSKKPEPKIPQVDKNQRRNSKTKRKTQMQRLTIPLEDLLNDCDPWSQPSSPSSTATSTSLALVEARIKTYANNAFKQLIEDFVFDLREMFESRDQTEHIINSFTDEFSRILRSEIILTSQAMKMPEINFELDIAIPDTRKVVYPSLRSSISEFSARKLTFPQDIEHKLSELVTVAAERDKSRIEMAKVLKSRRKQFEKNRKIEAELNARDKKLERYQNTLSRRRLMFEREMDTFDAEENQMSEGNGFKKLFTEELTELKREVNGMRRRNAKYELISKINAILNESVDMKKSRESLMQAVLKVNDSLGLFSMSTVSTPPRKALTPIPNSQRSPFSSIQKPGYQTPVQKSCYETPRRPKRQPDMNMQDAYFKTPNREFEPTPPAKRVRIADRIADRIAIPIYA